MNNIKDAKISAAILSRIGRGDSVQVAIDAVLGCGWYSRVVGEIWESLRAKSEGRQVIHPIIPIDDERGGAVYIQRRSDDIGDQIRLSLCRASSEIITPNQALKLAEALAEMANAIQRDEMTPAQIAEETKVRR